MSKWLITNIFVDAKLLLGVASSVWEHERKFDLLDALFKNRDSIILTDCIVKTIAGQNAFPNINSQDIESWIAASKFTIVTTSFKDSYGDYASKKSIVEALTYPEYLDKPYNILSFENEHQWTQTIKSSPKYIFTITQYMERKLRRRELSLENYEAIADCYTRFIKRLQKDFPKEQLEESICDSSGVRKKDSKARLWEDWDPPPEIIFEAIALMKKHPLNLWDRLKEAENRGVKLSDQDIDEVEKILTCALSDSYEHIDTGMRTDLFSSIRKVVRD